MIEFCSLASGSNGNCYYIANQTDAILVDCGISNRRFVERANMVQIDISKIRAIFVSHEHFDHIAGIKSVSNHLRIPVYFSTGTYNALSRRKCPNQYHIFNNQTPVSIASQFNIVPFKKHHDAADPFSFVVEINNFNIGVITDIGIADDVCQYYFSKCNAVFLEMNYDAQMLINGSYPDYLKQRIASEIGHLSNMQALELINKCASPNLKNIIVSHISAENNSHQILSDILQPYNQRFAIELAPRFSAGKKYIVLNF